MNFVKYKLQTFNKDNFLVEFSNGLDCIISVLPTDKMATYEKKCQVAIEKAIQEKKMIWKPDIHLIIELAADIWTKKYRPELVLIGNVRVNK